MSVRIINADVLAGLAELPDESVHCVVTSPPYWGLRDYGQPGQIGLEATPEAFVARMVEVFRDVRRVLRQDGTCWLNLGDSYATSPAGVTKGDPLATSGLMGGKSTARIANSAARTKGAHGLKPKDMIGIPWRVALALQADGWWLRSDIIWNKPNPMPESVTDRPTKAHEYVFMLTKAASYWYDADAIREQTNHVGATWEDRKAMGFKGDTKHPTKDAIEAGLSIPSFAANANGRNARSVWTIATAPFSEAHFATFPPELPAKCIKAGCPKGGTVLDPFGGAGTTGLVADRLQRNAVLIELNPEYAAMAEKRIANDAGGLFASVDVQKTAEVQMALLEAAE
jgi:DNA modification methylase